MLSLAEVQLAGFLLSRRRPQICGLAKFKLKLLLNLPEIYSKPAWGLTVGTPSQGSYTCKLHKSMLYVFMDHSLGRAVLSIRLSRLEPRSSPRPIGAHQDQ